VSGRVEGKVALITGGARGQGRSHALRLAEEGADIIALDICAPIRGVEYEAATEEDLAKTAELVEGLGRRVFIEKVDVRDLAGMRSATSAGVQALGSLDIVIANAGIAICAPWDKVTAEIWNDTIGINLTGVWNTVVTSAPHLIDSGGGSIILVSSAAGIKGMPFFSAYVASKHGVTGLARAFAHELAMHSIRVNSIHPMGVNTPMSMRAKGPEDHGRQVFEAAVASNPKIVGMYTPSLPIDEVQPIDTSNAVLYLASDEARYVTAMAMTIDGGQTQY
jgi:SDR family mycofactocin-dependent oxidoreductase